MIEYPEKRKEVNIEPMYDDFYWEIKAANDCICNHQFEHSRYSHEDMIQAVTLLESIKKMSNANEKSNKS